MNDLKEAPLVAVQKLHPEARLPRYAHTGPYGDLAADLYAVAACELQPGETAALSVGLALGLPPGFGALILDRSSMAMRGLMVLAGVIDAGYRGELKVILHNLAKHPQSLAAGDRIAQMRLVPLVQADFRDAASVEETLRGVKGFGSTGA